ncbi:hypothetical protein PanWU01x14_054820 [Parasponia andersonii]|uniref:Uncharacterized protein n=1 Tax=Parasponia andersonii TaxID=3476 RepID=A0A2P5DKW2_PARAD|nr:hypothetical protein PanWU01x14_054820 [Parasponia andersonii]
MGEHVYAYRGGGGHSNYGGDRACRTVVYDSDGGKRTVVGCSPYDTECYVVETEVTERIVGGSPLVTDSAYRYGSPPKKAVGPARDYGPYGSYEKYRGPESPYSDHRRPQDVVHFLDGVQIEASRPPPPTARRYSPSNGAVRPATHSTPGYYGDPYKNRSSGGYGGYSSSDDDEYDRDEEAGYYKKPVHRIRPEPDLKVGNGRGGGGGKWAVAPASTHPTTAAAATNSNLSLPTNNIDDAIDFLIGGGGGGVTRTYTSTETHVGHPPPAYGYNSDSKLNCGGGSEAARRPYGYNSSAKGGGGLESTAAVKPYGAKSNQTASYPTGSTTATTGSHGAVIDCYEAARRYNGKVVRT